MDLNKKGYIRVLESVLAVLIIFAVIFFLSYKVQKQDISIPSVVESSQNFILEVVSINETLRSCIIQPYTGNCIHADFEYGSIECGDIFASTINSNLPRGYEYACEVCRGPLSCLSGEPIPLESVYTKAKFFAVDNEEVKEKVLRLYYWRQAN